MLQATDHDLPCSALARCYRNEALISSFDIGDTLDTEATFLPTDVLSEKMILWLCIQVLVILSVLLTILYYFFLLPPRHPQNIPAVPFWVVLIPFFYDVDQEETYRRYIEKPLQNHGAVKFFFGARWNILVQRSSYIAELFKDEEVFQKSGNQKKIPHSVLAQFLGDNIISAHGANWKLYQNIIKRGLQRKFETEPIVKNANLLCKLLEEAQRSAGNKGVPIQVLMQRYTIANVSESVLQTDFETLKNADATLSKLQSAVKREIFKPIFMNFPFLDHLPIPSRIEARRLVNRFSEELLNQLLRSHEKLVCSIDSDKLGSRLVAARDEGMISEKQLRDNLNVVFVAGQENPQLLPISTMYLLAKEPHVQSRLRAEVRSRTVEGPTHEVLLELPYLTAVIYESLRLFPPISQLVNRRTSSDVLLGNRLYIPKDTYLGYNCYSTNRDLSVWGQTANEFQPDRWGTTSEEIARRYRRARARSEFISFHGGKRACLGENFAMLEMRISLFQLVRRFEWKLDPRWPDRKTPAGPLYPRALRLIFHDLLETACKPGY